MSSSLNSISIYREWYYAAGFRQEGSVYDAINAGRQRFYSATDIRTQEIKTRISGWVVSAFTVDNARVERWPSNVRQRLNASSGPSSRKPRPFDTWARPRDIEKRKQALTVWSSLLLFLVFHWSNYGADRALEAMRLHMSYQLKDCIDTIRIYAELGGRFRKAFEDEVKAFFTLAVMDSDATPTTNPLLWWLAVLIQVEVLDNQPRWVIDGVSDMLDFPGKLEALDHYARVLVLHSTFYKWVNDRSPQAACQSDREKVVKSLDAVSIDWVDQDQERPHRDFIEEYRTYHSSEWETCYSYINPILTQWLTDRTKGPIGDIIKLRRKRLVLFRQRTQYNVKMEIHDWFTTDPCISDCYPSKVATKSTIEEANKAARGAFRHELGRKQDARRWDEVYEDDGRVRIRAVFRDMANDAKAIVWVEEEVVDEPIYDPSDEEPEKRDEMFTSEDEEPEEDEEDEEDEDDEDESDENML